MNLLLVAQIRFPVLHFKSASSRNVITSQTWFSINRMRCCSRQRRSSWITSMLFSLEIHRICFSLFQMLNHFHAKTTNVFCIFWQRWFSERDRWSRQQVQGLFLLYPKQRRRTELEGHRVQIPTPPWAQKTAAGNDRNFILYITTWDNFSSTQRYETNVFSSRLLTPLKGFSVWYAKQTFGGISL